MNDLGQFVIFLRLTAVYSSHGHLCLFVLNQWCDVLFLLWFPNSYAIQSIFQLNGLELFLHAFIDYYYLGSQKNVLRLVSSSNKGFFPHLGNLEASVLRVENFLSLLLLRLIISVLYQEKKNWCTWIQNQGNTWLFDRAR